MQSFTEFIRATFQVCRSRDLHKSLNGSTGQLVICRGQATEQEEL